VDTFLVILQLAFGVAGLHFGAEWLVAGSSRLALSYGVKPLVIGLTLVAFGTSAPELTVSLAGALQGSPDVSVGNVIGSNIANIGLVLGLSASIRPIKVDMEVFRRDLPFMLFATLLIVVLPFIGGAFDNNGSAAFLLSRWKGVVLLLVFGVFIWLMFRGARTGAGAELKRKPGTRLVLILLAAIGLGALVAGGKLFVDGAVLAALKLGVPELVIGLTIVAVGTSLPELATSIIAIIRGETAISLGNVVGSNIFNLTLVLGAVAVIAPLAVSARIMQFDMIVMLAFSVGVVALAWRGKCLTRRSGMILLGAYALYVTNLFAGWI
jgi:cation:H+ antiporter